MKTQRNEYSLKDTWKEKEMLTEESMNECMKKGREDMRMIAWHEAKKEKGHEEIKEEGNERCLREGRMEGQKAWIAVLRRGRIVNNKIRAHNNETQTYNCEDTSRCQKNPLSKFFENKKTNISLLQKILDHNVCYKILFCRLTLEPRRLQISFLYFPDCL